MTEAETTAPRPAGYVPTVSQPHLPGERPESSSPPPAEPPEKKSDAFASVLVLLTLGGVGFAVAMWVAGRTLGNPVFNDAGITLGLVAGLNLGALVARRLRNRPAAPAPEVVAPTVVEPPIEPQETTDDASQSADDAGAADSLFPRLGKGRYANWLPSLTEIEERIKRWYEQLGILGSLRVGIAALGVIFTYVLLTRPVLLGAWNARVILFTEGIAALAALLEGTAAVYLSRVSRDDIPEAEGLARAARFACWTLGLAALSLLPQWYFQTTVLSVLHFGLVICNVTLCFQLASTATRLAPNSFDVDLGFLSVAGERWNIVASVLDAAERQFGIDLRSTWALAFVRRAIEPLIISLLLVAWLSTSVTVVGVEEQAIVERLGVPQTGAPVSSGLHLHWPWPIDRVYRYPVRRLQTLGIGHEGEEKEGAGPENVIWAVQHAENEFSLVLGNGRDLITVDAAVHFRITDPRRWRYSAQNPADALRAIAYRAVMRNTVNKTLADALSENIVALTNHMRAMVQAEADSLGLGVEIAAFTVGGMHPPVPVASAYEGVVAAQIRRTTSVIEAQVYHNSVLPAAEDTVIVRTAAAQAEGANALAQAAGDAWAFRVLEAQYRADPSEFFFRRRLETLEQALGNRHFVVVDSRFLRDGGELWLTP